MSKINKKPCDFNINTKDNKFNLQSKFFALTAIINNIGTYIFVTYFIEYKYIESLNLRIATTILCTIILLKNYWPKKAISFFNVYYLLSLMISIPFLNTYLLMSNNYENFWQINYAISIFVLSTLTNQKKFISILIIGISLAALYYRINHQYWPKFLGLNITALYIFSSLIIMRIILLKSKKLRSDFLLFSNYANKNLNKIINRKSNDLLQLLNDKEEFISNIINEFQEPVSSVKQTLHELMVNWDNLKVKDKTKYLSKMYQDLHKLYENISNVSSFSKQNSNLIMTEINFKELINKLLYNSEKQFFFNQKNITFKIYYDNNLPTYFTADKQKLKHAIELLLDNAIKFGYDNTEVIINVEIEEENLIKFSIENDGVLIPADEETLIFQSFVQSTKTKNTHSGKGLGLTVAKNIINAHNGVIWVDNNNRNIKDTKISFIIPINITSSNQNILSRREIVCVDDDSTVIDNYKLLLNYENYKNIYFTSPQEAIEYINKNFYKIDLILLDLMMPEMHGFKFLSHLRSFAKTKNIPIVINSCISDKNDVAKSFTLGANDYIQKPFVSQKLYDVLNNYIIKLS